MPPRLATLAALLFIWAVPAHDAFGQCSASERRKMRDAGLSDVRIARACEEQKAEEDEDDRPPARQVRPQQQRQRLSNICQTPVMWCTLGQQGPTGTPCWCNSPYGPINGQLSSPR